MRKGEGGGSWWGEGVTVQQAFTNAKRAAKQGKGEGGGRVAVGGEWSATVSVGSVGGKKTNQ